MSEELLSAGRTLGVIGAGVMGTALLKGMLDHGLLSRRQAWGAAKTEASCEEVAQSLGITTSREYGDLVGDAEIVLIAVKPGQAGKVAEKLKASGLRKDALLISVLAGVTTERFEGLLGSENPFVRAMPNTPCLVGHGGRPFTEKIFFTAAESSAFAASP